MAQLAERVLGKDEVGGSNPPSSSINRTPWCSVFILLAGEGRTYEETEKIFPLL